MPRLTSIPIERPVATAMLFLGIVLLGCIGWARLPVELLPALGGSELFVQFQRRGAEPAVVEQEILLPLEAAVKALGGVEETEAQIRGSGGRLRVQFDRHTNGKVRELELGRVAAELARQQPQGSFINVNAQDLSLLSRIVMIIQVTGGDDPNALRDLIDDRIQPRLLAIPGLSQVIATGGAPRALTVWFDPDRAATLGVHSAEVLAALNRAVGRLGFAGGVEDAVRRESIMLDGRPGGIASLGEIRIDPRRPVLLRHVADIELGIRRQDQIYRVNGAPAVGLLVFQNEGENLVQIGRDVRRALEQLRVEYRAQGLDFVLGFDAAATIEQQLQRLKSLALSGFLVALAVLYLFLREVRAVAVVAIAVPVSLLGAAGLLYLGGWSLNLITLLGFAIGIGMLVDNSIVVYEAVQRAVDLGSDAKTAAAAGIRRTLRAILAGSVTNAIVFVPGLILIDDPLIRDLLQFLAVTILLPLAASLLVAAGLVPLLAQRLTAPAALARQAADDAERVRYAGLRPPQRTRALFTGMLKVALRRPTPWLVTVGGAVLATIVIAVPWVLITTTGTQAQQPDELRFDIEFPNRPTLAAAGIATARLEQALLATPGVERVESTFGEDQGTLTAHLLDRDQRPATATAGAIRKVVTDALRELPAVRLRTGTATGGEAAGGGLTALLGGTAAEVAISGPDMARLNDIAQEIGNRLRAIPEIGEVEIVRPGGQDEVRITPRRTALTDYGLHPEAVLNALGVVSREGIALPVGFTFSDGREIPIEVRRPERERERSVANLTQQRVPTTAGLVPLGVLATISKEPPAEVITHHNGRREMLVRYRLGGDAPSSGPARVALEEQIRDAVRLASRPAGYAIEAPTADDNIDWFKRLVLPAILLLYAVLAITFESLTLPALVLISVPLTVLGATWALVVTGTGLEMMALLGVLTLLGLTVNPAILLVDRMQEKLRAGSGGAAAAALAAVRERTRPVLMTAATTIAGLWPLALATGRENEIWPPFAIVMIGGLTTSTLLTLLVIPVGFVFLARLDRLLGRLGPWVVLLWLALSVALLYPLVASGLLASLTWQILTGLLLAVAVLGGCVAFAPRPAPPEPDSAAMSVDVRFLRKVYGAPGPILRAWHQGTGFAERVLALGGDPRNPRLARRQAVTLALLLSGVLWLLGQLQTTFWRLGYTFIAVALTHHLILALLRVIGRTDAHGRVRSGDRLRHALVLLPWLALAAVVWQDILAPRLAGTPATLAPVLPLLLAGLVFFLQFARHTALRIGRGALPARLDSGRLIAPRNVWRAFCRRVFGLDLPRREIEALRPVTFQATTGMVGLLGPNGAGKTTLLRLLAGVLEPSLGTIRYGGARLDAIRTRVAHWVGYLPQEFGLPLHLTAREYLSWFALLYGISPRALREARVTRLLHEVGLAARAEDRIGSFSGGMRQRVAVARALLREPPVIIVDEPTVGLDPRERIRFRTLLTTLARSRIVLFSTHVVEDVAVSCDRVIVMARGAIVHDGAPESLAEIARDHCWELVSTAGTTPVLAAGAKIVDRVPLPDGRERLRVLATARPNAAATPLEPSLEDGYLYLIAQAAPTAQLGNDDADDGARSVDAPDAYATSAATVDPGIA